MVSCSYSVDHKVSEKLALVSFHIWSSVAPDGTPDQVIPIHLPTNSLLLTPSPHPDFPSVVLVDKTKQEAIETFYNRLEQEEKDEFNPPSKAS